MQYDRLTVLIPFASGHDSDGWFIDGNRIGIRVLIPFASGHDSDGGSVYAI